jgi:hypothetical protein
VGKGGVGRVWGHEASADVDVEVMGGQGGCVCLADGQSQAIVGGQLLVEKRHSKSDRLTRSLYILYLPRISLRSARVCSRKPNLLPCSTSSPVSSPPSWATSSLHRTSYSSPPSSASAISSVCLPGPSHSRSPSWLSSCVPVPSEHFFLPLTLFTSYRTFYRMPLSVPSEYLSTPTSLTGPISLPLPSPMTDPPHTPTTKPPCSSPAAMSSPLRHPEP